MSEPRAFRFHCAKCDESFTTYQPHPEVLRVLDAARAWRDMHLSSGSGVAAWAKCREELRNAIDALDAPAGRYRAQGVLGGVWDAVEGRFLVNAEIAAALNAQERKP